MDHGSYTTVAEPDPILAPITARELRPPLARSHTFTAPRIQPCALDRSPLMHPSSTRAVGRIFRTRPRCSAARLRTLIVASAPLFAVTVLGSSRARAQSAADSVASCEGEIVQAFDIQTDRPLFSGAAAKWRTAANAVGLHHATTRAEVIAPFLALHLGRPCTERRRVESERILRAQPFIGDARITTSHDSLGRLVVHVRTTDEIPALIGARFRGVRLPLALSIGNSNIGGLGLLLAGNIERADGYRVGIGGRLILATTFGHPYRFTIEGDRARLGSQFHTEYEHPLFTDLQRVAWHVAYRSSEEFRGVSRPADDQLALNVRQERWEASGITRAFGSRTISVIGLAASRVHLVPADTGILVTRTGFAPDTGTVLRGRFAPFMVTRAGIIAGVRRVQFTTVHGFDALFGSQDVASGFMFGVFGAKGLAQFGERDNFVSTAAYVGAGAPRAVVGLATELEGRRDEGTNRWDSVIESGRAALYMKPSMPFGITLSDEFSGGRRSRLPLQLSFADSRGGMHGYLGSTLAGAQRNIVRAEVRRSAEAAIARSDVGVALFGEAGTLWAGDAPYGISTTRESAGISFLAAYPTRSKRVYRLDLAMALAHNGSRGRFELRLSSEDRTNRFWIEPDDVSRARTGAVPSSLFSWQ